MYRGGCRLVSDKAKRVLLVEDDLETQRIVRAFLSKATFDVVSAERLSEALDRLAQEHFDAVITDLSLPDSRGADTFRKVEESFPDIAVVVLTGSYDESLGIKAVQQGAQDFLLKDQLDLRLLRRSLLYAIERQRLRKGLLNLALRDPLTRLYNRRGLAALAEHQLTLAQREDRTLVAVSVDVDGFKKINDTYGHEEGDRALIRVAKVLRMTFRAPDVLARLGGDEFVVIATTGHPEAIALIAARLRARLKTANRVAGAPYCLSVSIGVSTLAPRPATTPKDVLRAADRAMYDDKRWRRGHGLRVGETSVSSVRRGRRSGNGKARRNNL